MKWLARGKAESIYGIEIHGNNEFRARTRDALRLLYSTPGFEAIQQNLAILSQGKRSGMRPWSGKPTFVVGTATWKHSSLWYAGAIAHDATHAMLYREAKKGAGGREPAGTAWTGPEAERKCLAFQKQVLAHLGAGKRTIAYIDQWAQKPTYQGESRGWRGWLNYARRRW